MAFHHTSPAFKAEAQRLARLQLLGDIEALINGTYGD